MKKLTMAIFMGVLAFALMGTSSVLAGNTFIPVSGLMHYEIVDEGTQWIDDDGILHIRDAMMTWELLEGESDLVGTGWGRWKANIDLATGNGDTQGLHIFEVSFGDEFGTFRGRADAIYTGFVMAGQYVAKGYDGLAGLQFRNDCQLVYSSGIATYDGYIWEPGGGGDDKVYSVESKSWSSVKALFR